MFNEVNFVNIRLVKLNVITFSLRLHYLLFNFLYSIICAFLELVFGPFNKYWFIIRFFRLARWWWLLIFSKRHVHILKILINRFIISFLISSPLFHILSSARPFLSESFLFFDVVSIIFSYLSRCSSIGFCLWIFKITITVTTSRIMTSYAAF